MSVAGKGGRLGRTEAVESLGISAKQLVLSFRREMSNNLLYRRDAVGPRRVGMWVVRLAHDVILANLVEACDAVIVLDEATEDVVSKQLPNVQGVEIDISRRVVGEFWPRITQ